METWHHSALGYTVHNFLLKNNLLHTVCCCAVIVLDSLYQIVIFMTDLCSRSSKLLEWLNGHSKFTEMQLPESVFLYQAGGPIQSLDGTGNVYSLCQFIHFVNNKRLYCLLYDCLLLSLAALPFNIWCVLTTYAMSTYVWMDWIMFVFARMA